MDDNKLKMVHIKGKVFSGSGEGTKFTEQPWAKKQITEKLGYIPHPGTLNIRITENGLKLKNFLDKITWMEISPPKGFCRGKLAKAYFIDNLKCAIIKPEVENYPQDVIELMAPINLRKTFKLKDGDNVEVKITIP
jgi:riboflavin kinase